MFAVSRGSSPWGKAVAGKAVAASGSRPATGKAKATPARSHRPKPKVETREMRKRRREDYSDTDDSCKALSEDEILTQICYE